MTLRMVSAGVFTKKQFRCKQHPDFYPLEDWPKGNCLGCWKAKAREMNMTANHFHHRLLKEINKGLDEKDPARLRASESPCGPWHTYRVPESLFLRPLLAIVKRSQLPGVPVLVAFDHATNTWLNASDHSQLPKYLTVERWAVVHSRGKQR